MKIKAVDTLKGELVLASINRSLRAGQEIAISEEAYFNDDIQRVMNKMVFVSEGDVPKAGNANEERYVIICRHRKPLTLPTLPFALVQGQTYGISGKQLKKMDIQQALSLGLIENLGLESGVVLDPEFGGDEEEGDPAPAPKTPPPPAPQAKKAAPPPQDEVDCEIVDDAEQFRKTGQARTIMHEKPKQPANTYIYDPNNELAEKKPQMANSYIYDPIKEQQKEMAAAKAAAQAAQAKKGTAASEEKSSSKKAGVKSIKPVGRIKRAGESGGDDLGGDGVDMEML